MVIVEEGCDRQLYTQRTHEHGRVEITPVDDRVDEVALRTDGAEVEQRRLHEGRLERGQFVVVQPLLTELAHHSPSVVLLDVCAMHGGLVWFSRTEAIFYAIQVLDLI